MMTLLQQETRVKFEPLDKYKATFHPVLTVDVTLSLVGIPFILLLPVSIHHHEVWDIMGSH